jgi:PRC-barrel domain
MPSPRGGIVCCEGACCLFDRFPAQATTNARGAVVFPLKQSISHEPTVERPRLSGLDRIRNHEEADMEAVSETGTSIAASKVNGTAVYDTGGESIGKIYDLMIDKVSGKVAYAIMSFGGFLGMGDSYHPLPWPLLKYDTGLSGYVVNIAKNKLEAGPSYVPGEEPVWGDRDYDRKVYGYYGTDPFWP